MSTAAASPGTEAPQTPASDGTPVVKDTTIEDAKNRDREVYRRLYGGTGSGEPEASAPATAPAQTAPPVGTQQPAKKPEPSTEDGAKTRELVEVAHAILKRDGLPEKARKAMLENLNPQELEELVEHRRKVQTEVDRLGNKAAQLERQAAQPGKPAKTPDGTATATEDDLSDLTPKQAGIVKKLRDEGDTDRATEMLGAFRDGKAAPAAPATQRSDPATTPQAPDPKAVELQEVRLLVALREPLHKLSARFPQLKDETGRLEVIRTAGRLLEAGVFDTPDGKPIPPDQVLERAATVKFGGGTTQDAQRRLLERNQIERNGQPDAAPSREAPPATLVGKDRDRQAYRLLMAGKTPEEVSKALERPTAS